MLVLFSVFMRCADCNHIKVLIRTVMFREKKPTKESLPLKETRKCKSHLFKDAYDHARKRKLDLVDVKRL